MLWRPLRITSIESRSKRQPRSGHCISVSIICGWRMSKANLRLGHRTVKARLKSSDSISMSVFVSRPITRPKMPSGCTESAGIVTPIDRASTEQWCVVLVRSFPEPLVVVYW
jgi:hypothetical protein